MPDYVAYHSTEVMGYEYEACDSTTFVSRKPRSVLDSAIGERVWTISGTGTKNRSRKARFRLMSVYRPSEIRVSTDFYEITGPTEFAFDPPVELNPLDWFPPHQEDSRRKRANDGQPENCAP